jgi:hypothetical protein
LDVKAGSAVAKMMLHMCRTTISWITGFYIAAVFGYKTK